MYYCNCPVWSEDALSHTPVIGCSLEALVPLLSTYERLPSTWCALIASSDSIKSVKFSGQSGTTIM